ncbi:hypothetical protein BHM03_00023790 [Ensete ventricosum]|nr:hypothetical protein BHM03_00023790 [Ensete ventricosum]
MGLVIDLSLPLIFFAVLLGVGCYFLGRAKGRQDVLTGAGVQIYGAPVPPSGAVVSSRDGHCSLLRDTVRHLCRRQLLLMPKAEVEAGPCRRAGRWGSRAAPRRSFHQHVDEIQVDRKNDTVTVVMKPRSTVDKEARLLSRVKELAQMKRLKCEEVGAVPRSPQAAATTTQRLQQHFGFLH